MKKSVVLFAAIIAVVCFVAIIGWNILSDKSEATYATYADAERADAVAKGWTPDFVPRSATDIAERHWLDSNQMVVEFSFAAEDGPAMTASFSKVPDSEEQELGKHLPWKPSEIDVFSREDEGMRGYLAINWAQRRARYWNR